MKLRIFTSMLLVVLLSAFNSFTASACGDCKSATKCCSHYRHHSCRGHNNYMYGPDGWYAKHKKACCNKEKSCSKKATCSKSTSCHKSMCGRSCHHTYRRAYYHEDCCGHGYLTTGCEKKCNKSKDTDDDNDD